MKKDCRFNFFIKNIFRCSTKRDNFINISPLYKKAGRPEGMGNNTYTCKWLGGVFSIG